MKATRNLLAVLVPALIVASAALVGCGQVNDDSIVATVDGKPITVGYMEAKWAKMVDNDPTIFPDSLSLEEVQDRVIDTLVKKELLVNKAYAEKYIDDEVYQKSYKENRQQKLMELLKNKYIVDKIPEYTEEDFKEHYKYLGQQADSRHIEVDTEEEARRIYEEIQSGELSFHDAVLKYTTHPDRDSGGKMPTIAFGTSIESVENALFNMKIGEVSEPVKIPNGWSLYVLDDIKTVESPPYEQMREQIKKRLETRSLRTIGEAFGQEILDRYGFEFHWDVALEVIPLLPDDMTPSQLQNPPIHEKPILKLSDEQKEMVLWEIEGEKYTLADWSDIYDALSIYERPTKAARARGIYYKVRRDMTNRVLPREAENLGLDEDPEFLVTMKEYEEQNCIGAVRRMLVDKPINITEQDARKFYEENPLLYTRRFAVICKQLVTNTEEEIQEAWTRVQAGEPFDSIGADLSITWPKSWMTSYFTPDSIANPENEVYRQVLRLEEVGDITPPFPYQSYWAIYQMVENSPPTLLPYEEVSARANREAFQSASAARLESLLVVWRNEAVVEIDEDVLRKTQKGEAANPLRQLY